MSKEKLESQIPASTLSAIYNWVETGEHGGHFLTAVLENNLFGAVARADQDNQRALVDIVKYLFNYCPGDCHGSKDKVRIWEMRKRDEREASASTK